MFQSWWIIKTTLKWFVSLFIFSIDAITINNNSDILTTCFCLLAAPRPETATVTRSELKDTKISTSRSWKTRRGTKRNPSKIRLRSLKSKNLSTRNSYNSTATVIIYGKTPSFSTTNIALEIFRESKPNSGKDFHISYQILSFSMGKYNHRMPFRVPSETATSCPLSQPLQKSRKGLRQFLEFSREPKILFIEYSSASTALSRKLLLMTSCPSIARASLYSASPTKMKYGCRFSKKHGPKQTAVTPVS